MDRKVKNVISRIWRFQGRVRRLRRIMRIKDTLRLTFPKGKTRELKVYLTSIKRNIVLRRGTSDIWCLENVFLDQEYKTPFQVDPKVIIDAGANIGMVTLFFSQKYPQATIIAIEPEASNFAILRKNCAGLPNVTLINAALWPTEQALVIQDSAADKWAFSVTEGKKLADLEPVKAVTIPGLLRQLGVEYIDILKLDIEGAERELFNIGAESWLGAVGQIIIELHDRFISGCAFAFYAKVTHYPFIQEIQGKNIFINFRTPCMNPE
jgi:FkbM family methyltransferase